MGVLKRGDSGSLVEEAQTLLKNQGYYKGAVDGIFGPGTERSVEKFQRRSGLGVDGIVGKNTWTQLRRQPQAPQTVEDGQYTLHICRKTETSESTISDVDFIAPDGTVLFSCVMLERPGPDTTTPGLRLRIPEGTYRMKWQDVTGLAGIRPHLPVPWLYNDDVPDDRYIYIHNGNKPSHTDGCLLAGRDAYPDFVSSSVNTLTLLKAQLMTVDESQIRVVIDRDYAHA